MERFKKVWRRILFPGGKAMICLAIVSAVLLAWVFVFDFRYNPFAYLSYILSAYTLTAVCLAAYRQVKKGIAVVESKSKHVNRYLHDVSSAPIFPCIHPWPSTAFTPSPNSFPVSFITLSGSAASPSTISAWPSCAFCCSAMQTGRRSGRTRQRNTGNTGPAALF